MIVTRRHGGSGLKARRMKPACCTAHDVATCSHSLLRSSVLRVDIGFALAVANRTGSDD